MKIPGSYFWRAEIKREKIEISLVYQTYIDGLYFALTSWTVSSSSVVSVWSASFSSIVHAFCKAKQLKRPTTRNSMHTRALQ